MNNNTVDINSTQVDQLLNTLGDTATTNKIMFEAIKAGAEVLQENTINRFRGAMGGVADNFNRWNGKPFWAGVIVSTEKAYLEAKVSIMGDHRMKWFEKGTSQRQTKGRKITGYQRNRAIREGKGHNTGAISGKWFFKSARQNTNAIDEAITQSINNALASINK